ncbi:MAG: hypothetical protein ACYDDU_00580 [Dermatophilaceae bacterium]
MPASSASLATINEVGGQLAQHVPPADAVACHRRIDDRDRRRQVHQHVGGDVRGIGAGHLGNSTEQDPWPP